MGLPRLQRANWRRTPTCQVWTPLPAIQPEEARGAIAGAVGHGGVSDERSKRLNGCTCCCRADSRYSPGATFSVRKGNLEAQTAARHGSCEVNDGKKGRHRNPDSLVAFRRRARWGLVVVALFIAKLAHGIVPDTASSLGTSAGQSFWALRATPEAHA